MRLACSLWSHYPSVLANSFIHKNILLYKQKPDSTFFSLFNYLFVWLPWFILFPPHFTSFLFFLSPFSPICSIPFLSCYFYMFLFLPVFLFHGFSYVPHGGLSSLPTLPGALRPFVPFLLVFSFSSCLVEWHPGFTNFGLLPFFGSIFFSIMFFLQIVFFWAFSSFSFIFNWL